VGYPYYEELLVDAQLGEKKRKKKSRKRRSFGGK